MFCSNCGSELTAGAKFCSECGTKVEDIEDIKVKDLGTLAFDEAASVSEAVANDAGKAEEAFKERVSFDWSNVIDEPQKKEVPLGIKSPWAATTGSISERELYSDMTQTDDKNRTMSFIDALRADKEERERAAEDSSFEYTEVLELDPELTGGTKPPKLHYAPLYEDVDEPVKTPFDDIYVSPESNDDMTEASSFESPVIELSEEGGADEDVRATVKGPQKFELPDFLRKAVGFGTAKAEAPEAPVVEEPVFEAPEAPVVEEPVFEASEEPVIEEPVFEAPEEPEAETEDFYLDEDLYLDIEESTSRTERMSRVDAHTLAGVYDETDLEENGEDEEESEQETLRSEQPVDEQELFTEMSETPAGLTGMTIAAPADEEEEIEALKRRLAELTGAVDMSSELAEETKPEPETEESEIQEYTESEIKEESTDAEEPSFEDFGSDFAFVPEVTEADEAMFAKLTPARETAQVTAAFSEPEIAEPAYEEPEEPEPDELVTEVPEETIAEKTVLEIPEENGAEVASFGLTEEDELGFSAPVFEEQPSVPLEIIEFEAPTPIMPDSQKEAFNNLVFDFPQKNEEPADEIPESESPVFESPVVGFAPAVTESLEYEAAPNSATEENVTETLQEQTLEDAFEPVSIPSASVKETPVSLGLEPKESDAVSLDDLERDLFSSAESDIEPETTKKIDKFYTLYRKNEEFQRLLDEEYSKLKGEHIEIPEEVTTDAAPVAKSLEDFAKDEEEKAAGEIADAVKDEAPVSLENDAEVKASAILEELSENSRPPEDATIYKVDMPEEVAETAEKTAAPDNGFSVETEAGADEAKFGLGGAETAAATAVGAVAAAGAAADKAAKKAAKKAEREAKKASKKAKEAVENTQVEYEDVDSGSTILTILAVLIAILLVVLLVIILILHVAPNSGIAMAIDQIIENITSKFSAVDMMGGYKLL